MSANPLASLDGAVYAPLYFAAVLTTAFYGVSCMQTTELRANPRRFFYYVHYPNDRRLMKIFVGVMWALDTIHEALTVAGVYKYIMAGLANPLTMVDEIPEIDASVALPTQAFFAYRIYIFSGNNILVPLLWVRLSKRSSRSVSLQTLGRLESNWERSFCTSVVAILYEVKSFYSVNGSIHVVGFTVIEDHFFTGKQSLATASLSVAAAVDVLIAIGMTFLLLRKQNAGGFADTAHILQRLTMFAVNTGSWTALFAVLSAIFTAVFRANALSAVFSIPLSSVYCNTLLANLNARTYIRGDGTTHNASTDLVTVRSPMSSEGKADNQSEETKITPPFARLKIRRTTEVVTFTDADRSTPEQKV
ncbi:hypothetical protein V8E55_009587 [Tylopilus felleus]